MHPGPGGSSFITRVSRNWSVSPWTSSRSGERRKIPCQTPVPCISNDFCSLGGDPGTGPLVLLRHGPMASKGLVGWLDVDLSEEGTKEVPSSVNDWFGSTEPLVKQAGEYFFVPGF